MRRPLLRWHGGKWLLAPFIIEQFKPHETYTEAFGGGASILLRKYRSRLEVYNDLDEEVVNLFRVVRERPAELAAVVAATPFSRAEFAEAYVPAECEIERARRMLIRSHMGFGSNAVHRKSGFRAAGLRAGVLPVHNWADMPPVILAVAERFRGVVIEQRPALEVLRANDGPSTLHYVDPPYPLDTRGDPGHDYAHEMTIEQHAELLDALTDLDGMVVLSGYAHPLYDERLSDWRRLERQVLADGARERTEVVWVNGQGIRETDGLFAA